MTNNYIKEINFIYWTTANDILINRSCFKKKKTKCWLNFEKKKAPSWFRKDLSR